jgi:hypothetical protein
MPDRNENSLNPMKEGRRDVGLLISVSCTLYKLPVYLWALNSDGKKDGDEEWRSGLLGWGLIVFVWSAFLVGGMVGMIDGMMHELSMMVYRVGF